MGHLPPKQALQFLQSRPDALFIVLICRSGNRSQEAGEALEC
jgi:rhodanese-related sulfurtransferase